MLMKFIARFCPRNNKEEKFARLTDKAIKCYETAEGKNLEEALSWIKKGDAIMALRDRTITAK